MHQHPRTSSLALPPRLLAKLDFPDMKFSLYFLGYEDIKVGEGVGASGFPKTAIVALCFVATCRSRVRVTQSEWETRLLIESHCDVSQHIAFWQTSAL